MIIRRRYNVGVYFSLAVAVIGLVLGLIGLIYFINLTNFYALYDYMNAVLMEAGMSSFDDLAALYGMDVAYFQTVFYITVIIMNSFIILISIPLLVFELLSLNDYKKVPEDFQKRKVLHILSLVFTLLVGFNLSSTTASLITDTLSILPTIGIVLAILGFSFQVREMIANTTYLNMKRNAANPNNDFQFRPFTQNEEQPQDTPTDEYGSIYPSGNQIGEEDLQKPQQEQVKVSINEEKLQESYELLAKLEKSYKNGEVSEEDYKRMKQTIIDNYLK